jgi:hypothetical protein
MASCAVRDELARRKERSEIKRIDGGVRVAGERDDQADPHSGERGDQPYADQEMPIKNIAMTKSSMRMVYIREVSARSGTSLSGGTRNWVYTCAGPCLENAQPGRGDG